MLIVVITAFHASAGVYFDFPVAPEWRGRKPGLIKYVCVWHVGPSITHMDRGRHLSGGEPHLRAINETRGGMVYPVRPCELEASGLARLPPSQLGDAQTSRLSCFPGVHAEAYKGPQCWSRSP